MGIVAAGWTIAEVPITNIHRASETASIERSRTILLSGSPYQITSGLARVPNLGSVENILEDGRYGPPIRHDSECIAYATTNHAIRSPSDYQLFCGSRPHSE